MNKKTLFAVFLVGILVFIGAGCGEKSLPDVQKQINDEPLESDGKVTIKECAELFAMAPKIDLRYNDLATSHPWTLKYYDKMAVLEKKYSITQDELSKACKTKASEPGFDEEVGKIQQEWGIIN